MLHLSNLCLFFLLFINLLGLTLVTGLWLRNAWFALTAGPWLFCTVGFFIESFHGLGDLSWLWPVTTILSAGLFLEVTGLTHFLSRLGPWLKIEEWKNELSPLLVPLPYGVLAGLFTYAMLWRYPFPNIDGSSEKIADLACLSSYLSGETIPVHDIWLYPFLSTYYYGFQYYAGALLGRILGLDPGTTYNLALCTLIALAGTAGVGAICVTTQKIWIRWLVSVGWLVGGSGVTGIVHFAIKNATVWNDFRFIGDPPLNRAPFGTFLTEYAQHFTRLSLPGEPLSYSIYLGDYHPPLAGFYLLGLGLLMLNLWNKGASPLVLAVAGATLPWCAIADTWNLPLQALGLSMWMIYIYRKVFADYVRLLIYKTVVLFGRVNPYYRSYVAFIKPYEVEVPRRLAYAWLYFLGGATVVMLMIYPYFRHFALSAQSYHTAIKWVPWNQHTPLLFWLLFLLPTIGLTMLSIFSFDMSLLPLGILWFGFLIFTEFVFVNDIYLGEFLRFNTTLKWWPWVVTGTLLTLGPRLLELKWYREIKMVTWLQRFIWIAALILISYPIYYFLDLANLWWTIPRNGMGELDGAAFLITDKGNPNLNDRLLFNYLRTAPKGVVVEHPDTDFTNYVAMTTLSGQQALLGWLGHEQLWRGYLYELQYRYDKIKALYDGNLPNAGEWMRTQGVDYILWFKNDGAEQPWGQSIDSEALWNKINASLQPQYAWHEFYHEPTRRVGLWERRKTDPIAKSIHQDAN